MYYMYELESDDSIWFNTNAILYVYKKKKKKENPAEIWSHRLNVKLIYWDIKLNLVDRIRKINQSHLDRKKQWIFYVKIRSIEVMKWIIYDAIAITSFGM